MYMFYMYIVHSTCALYILHVHVHLYVYKPTQYNVQCIIHTYTCTCIPYIYIVHSTCTYRLNYAYIAHNMHALYILYTYMYMYMYVPYSVQPSQRRFEREGQVKVEPPQNIPALHFHLCPPTHVHVQCTCMIQASHFHFHQPSIYMVMHVYTVYTYTCSWKIFVDENFRESAKI